MNRKLLAVFMPDKKNPVGCGPVLCTAKTNAIRLHSHVSLAQTN